LEVKVGTQGAVFVAQEEHTNHDDKPEKNSLSEEVLDKIKELEGFGLKPRGINAELAKCGMAPVNKARLKNYLATIRRNKRGNSNVTKISLNELKDWCLRNNDIPEKEDTVFVGKFEILALPKQMFRVFLTPKRLNKTDDKPFQIAWTS
jgi:hypothetical protein